VILHIPHSSKETLNYTFLSDVELERLKAKQMLYCPVNAEEICKRSFCVIQESKRFY
jgi:hypothetical protein